MSMADEHRLRVKNKVYVLDIMTTCNPLYNNDNWPFVDRPGALDQL